MITETAPQPTITTQRSIPPRTIAIPTERRLTLEAQLKKRARRDYPTTRFSVFGFRFSPFRFPRYPELEGIVGKAEILGEAARRMAPSLSFV